LEIIAQTVERFLETKPCRLIGQYDREPPFECGEEVIYRFTMHVRASPPSDLSLMIGDFRTNIHATLDHLVFALAFQHTTGDLGTRERDVSFPIYRDAEKFRAKRGKLVEVLAPDVLTRIEQLRPYFGRQRVDKGTRSWPSTIW
jgi:hypothetical protein